MSTERIDDLMRNGLRIIQDTRYFLFGMDAVLLAHFGTVKDRDKIIDLGTGTGVIPLLLSTRARDLQIHALEIQSELARLALRSVELNGLESVITVAVGDLCRASEIYGYEKYDLVTCNPPYMPLSIGPKSPKGPRAIARHEMCCTLSDVVQACSQLVRFKGRVAMVYRVERMAELTCLLKQKNLEPKRMRLIQSKADKAPNVFLIEAVKGANAGLHWLPTLVVYGEDGRYTPELMSVYYPEGIE